jgi:hypothetical protein
MKVFVTPDGTQWGVEVLVPGSSNAMVYFHHPDGRTARKDRYAWFLGNGPEAKSVTARLDKKRVLDALDEEELRVLVRGDTAVTFVILRVRGAIADAEVSGRMRYTRTWTNDGGTWRVLAAHIAPAAD